MDSYIHPYKPFEIEANWIVYAGATGWLDAVLELWGDNPIDEDLIISMWDSSRTKQWFKGNNFDEESLIITKEALRYLMLNSEERHARTRHG